MILFITNREIIKTGNTETIREDGGENSGDNLRFGEYHIDTKEFELYPEPKKESDTNYQNIQDKKFENLKGSPRFFSKLYNELIATNANGKAIVKNDVLFFIHGFNTDLKGVRKDFEHLQARYIDHPQSTVAHIIIFTWPGMHPKIPYHYYDDKQDAIRSGKAFARAIGIVQEFFQQFFIDTMKDGKLTNQTCNRNIHLMAHSMGNRVLKETMLTFGMAPIPQLFKEVILMAADVRWDSFENGEGFNRLIDFGERVHIFYHDNDKVLDISKYAKNFSNRLGRYGRKSKSNSQKDIFDINITGIKEDMGDVEEKLMNHWYYYTSSAVKDDVVKNIFSGKVSSFPYLPK